MVLHYDDDIYTKSIAIESINSTITHRDPSIDTLTGDDMCISATFSRALVTILPMTLRCLQCLRRYCDSNNRSQRRIHLLNMGKYVSILFVVFTGALYLWLVNDDDERIDNIDDNDVDDDDERRGYSANPNVYFYLWIVAYLIGFTCTFLVSNLYLDFCI